MIRDYFRIAMQGLRRRKIRSWLTMIGIFIGIAAVVSLISLGQGLQLAVATQFQALGSDRIVIQAKGLNAGPPGSNVPNPLTTKDLDTVKRVPGVDLAVGRIIKSVLVEHDQYRRVSYVVSYPKGDREQKFSDEANNYVAFQGRMLTPADKYKVVVGYSFYDKPLLGKEIHLNDHIMIQGQDFQVVGILQRTGSFQTDVAMIMNEDTLREVMDAPDEYSVIGVNIVDGTNIDDVALSITKELRHERGVKENHEDFTVQTTQQLLDTFNTVINVINAVLIGIASISIVVGGVGITNTMYTSVIERTRDIGIMKAIGAKNNDILYMFLIESGMLGLAGGFIGLLIGVGFGKLVEFIGRQALGTSLIQASFPPVLIIGALLFSFVVGALAGTLPAMSAAKMNPVDALSKAK